MRQRTGGLARCEDAAQTCRGRTIRRLELVVARGRDLDAIDKRAVGRLEVDQKGLDARCLVAILVARLDQSELEDGMLFGARRVGERDVDDLQGERPRSGVSYEAEAEGGRPETRTALSRPAR